MGIFGDRLYVSDIDEIVEISISKGKIIKKYEAKNAVFLNDIDIDKNGNVYVSDTGTGKIWVLKDGKASVWYELGKNDRPNGLYCAGNRLFVGIRSDILSFDTRNKKYDVFIKNTGGIDGLEYAGEGKYIFSDWTGHIYISKQNENKKLLLNTASEKINAADIEYVENENILAVPTFFHNTVSFYMLK